MDGAGMGLWDDPAWLKMQATSRLLELQRASFRRELVDPRSALGEVDQLSARFAGDSEVQSLVEAARTILSASLGPAFIDVSALRVLLKNLSEQHGDQLVPEMSLMPGFLEAVQLMKNGDDSAGQTLLFEMLKQCEDLPDPSPLRQYLAQLAPIERTRKHEDKAAHARLLDETRILAARPGTTDGERANLLVAAGGAAVDPDQGDDLEQIDRGIADLREAVTLTSDDHPDHVFHLATLAMAIHRRFEVTGSPAEFDEAVATAERARELARGPAHPHWTFVSDMLFQFRGRRAAGGPLPLTTLDSLHGRAWQVLLQTDPVAARSDARNAARGAVHVARIRLAAHDPSGALRALDAGRGLMLFAATEMRDPCTRLIEAGEPKLAERWRAEASPSIWLRGQVIEVLARDSDLLDPPTVAETQEALRRLGADALIYLVPAEPPMVGWAVIAPADGDPRYIALPNLVIEEKTEIERYLAAAATRNATLVNPRRDVGTAGLTDFVDRLDALCDWAWKAAIGPIVEPYLDEKPGHTPRLVLIPMGDLARVPWQAARRPDGTYLVELAAVSQAASARMLCASAAAQLVRHSKSGLMVADPDTGDAASDLPSARLEAYAIHRAFYPGATYVGRRPDGTVSGSGAGTPEDVRNWLRTYDSHAGTMVHFATHGVMETAADSASSRLLLADGDLTAEELISILDSNRRPVGLVVLAGCHTGQSIHGYDEAYSLGTVFLAAGARTVLSTQWSIPDRDTSLLMYMFHHFLITDQRPAWEALRQAQLWMLDDARSAPVDMPTPLRRMLADIDPARITSWAGFTHWGQ
ncbi:CHAT domain-containing protein [Kribbella sp. NPDC051718]|uniref:CHAT domain-containing protein n=1 Tax=Kribbella sp. NPDC051718 TaxID=3155168 RepID=UPI0034147FB4